LEQIVFYIIFLGKGNNNRTLTQCVTTVIEENVIAVTVDVMIAIVNVKNVAGLEMTLGADLREEDVVATMVVVDGAGVPPVAMTFGVAGGN
jgi:hypothetical protein